MRILLTGANGFIGSHIMAGLLKAGYEVVAAVRDPLSLKQRFPDIETVFCDFNTDTDPAVWLPRLHRIDAVINCAGILQGSRRQNMEAIHYLTPRALFAACRQAGVRQVIQISAISADEEAGTAYARSKKQADDFLRSLELDWIILRPSLIYAHGSYGGTSLLRGLAAMPWRIPVVGDGKQPFQPLHVDDLAQGILRLLERPEVRHVTLEPGGPETLGMADMLGKLRCWLGLPAVPFLRVPLPFVRMFARLGDWFGITSFNTTALQQLQYGNTGNTTGWVDATGCRPAGMDTWLQRELSHVQDRWHARLFFLRPLTRLILAALWLLSGLLALTSGHDMALRLLADTALPPSLIPYALYGSAALGIGIGLALLLTSRPRLLGLLQLTVIMLYTIALSIALPGLWVDPLGPLLKNIPILVLVLVWMAIESDR